MSSLATIVKDQSLISTLRIGFYGFAACSMVGIAAYIGYKAAGSTKKYALQSRHPDAHDKVKTKIVCLQFKNFNIYHFDILVVCFL